jgi:hypothetical protein
MELVETAILDRHCDHTGTSFRQITTVRCRSVYRWVGWFRPRYAGVSFLPSTVTIAQSRMCTTGWATVAAASAVRVLLAGRGNVSDADRASTQPGEICGRAAP